MEILRFKTYEKSINMAEEFIDLITHPIVNESDDINRDRYKSILNKLASDLKLNLSLIGTFGMGIHVMYPIVENLIRTDRLNIDLNPENIVLLTITALSVIYLEERKKTIRMEKDTKSLLEEMKLRGIGNGIVKKIVNCFKSIGNIIKVLFKHTPSAINGLIDIFAYLTLFVPFMNAVLAMINKYDLTIDTLIGNFLSLGVGITTLLAKQGVNWLIDKLKDKLNIRNKKIIDTETSLQQYPHADIIDTEIELSPKNSLINES